jgi:membrane protease YdiL (CAAX protease family)
MDTNLDVDDRLESQIDDEPAPFWSPWATVGWGLLVFGVFVLCQVAAAIVWTVVVDRPETAFDGDLLAIGIVVSASIGTAMVVGVTALRSWSRTRDALALSIPSFTAVAGWLAVSVVMLVASDTLTWVLGKPIVPDFMLDVVRSVTMDPLLWLAVIIAAPLFEELFFRGFLIEGLRRGRLGGAGAVIVTATCWASIHIQYGLYEIATIFVFGLVLGAARIRTGSLWVPVAMHVLTNLVATMEAYLLGT